MTLASFSWRSWSSARLKKVPNRPPHPRLRRGLSQGERRRWIRWRKNTLLRSCEKQEEIRRKPPRFWVSSGEPFITRRSVLALIFQVFEAKMPPSHERLRMQARAERKRDSAKPQA